MPDPQNDAPPDTFQHIAGLFWPQGDPAGLRQGAQAWRGVAQALDGIATDSSAIAASVKASNEGPAIEAFSAYWSKWEGGSGYFASAAQAARSLADALEQYAGAIEAARKRVEEIAAAAVTVVAVGIVLTVITAGISDAAAAAAASGLVAAAAAVGVDLTATVATILGTVLTGAALGGVASIVIDTAVQVERIAVFQDQPAFDWGEFAHSAELGFLTGGAGAGLGLAAKALVPVLADASPAFSRAISGFSNLPRWVQAGLRGSAVGGGMSAVVDAATAGKVDPFDVALGMVSGAGGDMAATAIDPSGITARILRGRAVANVAAALGIDDPAGLAALRQAYDVTAGDVAPFVVKVAGDMLPDLQADVAGDPGRKIVFVGRDGHSLAVVVRALDPAFFDANGVEIVLSRAVADSAIQDLELNAGRSFPELDSFRGASGKVSPDDITGSFQRLTDYLQRSGIPVGEPGSSVTLVDTSYKGTVQELLAALYPDTTFQGRYVFFGAAPDDPHPGTKVGYALDLDATRSSGGLPVRALPDDPALTFAHQDAIGSIEETLHGPMGSPTTVDGNGPVQQPVGLADNPLSGINPLRIAPMNTDPVVRQGVMDINLLAVKDYADGVAALQGQGVDVSGQLDAGFDHFRDQVRAWIAGGDVDPRFARFMDSFVRRADKGQVVLLDQALRQAGLTPDQARPLWQAFDQMPTLQDKQAFVQQFQQTLTR